MVRNKLNKKVEYQIVYSAKTYGNKFANITLIHLVKHCGASVKHEIDTELHGLCIYWFIGKNQCCIYGMLHILIVFR